MSMETLQYRRVGPYHGNGVTVSFPFDFLVFETSDVLVTIYDTVTFVEGALTLTVDYDVTMNPDQRTNPGGLVTLLVAPTSAKDITLTSHIPATQPMNVSVGGSPNPYRLEVGFDRAVALIQQLIEVTDRALVFSVSDPGIGLIPSIAARRGKLLGFDQSTGSPVVTDVSTGGALVSTFMASVLDDLTAIAARATLGIGPSDSPALAGINDAPLAGMRNKVTNPGCAVQQGAATALAATLNYGPVDCMRVGVPGAAPVSGSVIAHAGSGYASGIGAGGSGAWTNGQATVQHRIYSKNSASLSGRQITVSGKVFHNFGSSRNWQVKIAKPTATDNHAVQTVLSTSPTFACPDGAYTAFSFTATLGSSDALGGLALIVQDAATNSPSGVTFSVGDLECVIGSQAETHPEVLHRPYQFELMLCQFHRIRIDFLGVSFVASGAAQQCNAYHNLPTAMLRLPDLIIGATTSNVNASGRAVIARDNRTVLMQATSTAAGTVVVENPVTLEANL